MRISSTTCACLLALTSRTPPPLLCAPDEDDPTSLFFRRQLGALPSDPEKCLLQLRASLRAALEESPRVWVDIRVPALDASSRGVEPKLLANFALSAAQEVDAASGGDCGAPVILVHGLTAALAVSSLARDTALPSSGGTAAVVPLGPDDGEGGLGGLVDPEAISRLEESSCPILIVGPFDTAAHKLAVAARTGNDPGRTILLFNHRPSEEEEEAKGPLARLKGRVASALRRPPPLLSPLPAGYDTAFELLPLALQDSAILRGDKAPQASSSEWSPKAVVCRRYPAPWTLLVDATGEGYDEVSTFNQRPGPAALIDAVGRHVRSKQGDVSQPTGGLDDEAPAAKEAPAADELSLGLSLPSGVQCRTWEQIENAPISNDELKWYSASCLLRMRDANARAAPRTGAGLRDEVERALGESSTTAPSPPPPALDTSNDQLENALHLFAAPPEGYRARPLKLSGCAVLLVDAETPGDEDGGGCLRVDQIAIASEEEEGSLSSSWSAKLLDAVEEIGRRRKQGSVAVPMDTAWQAMCEERGYETQGDWLLRRL